MSRPPTWLIVLMYAAFSVLWIIAAGYLISLTLDDPVLRSRAYLAKELILVAVSSGLFYILLKFGREAVIPPVVDAVPGQSRLSRLLLMFLSLAMVAPLVSLGIIKVYGPEMERAAYADLQTIVDLKAEQIELWLTERHGDAEAIAVSQAFIERVANMQHKKDGHHRQLIRNRLDAVRNAYSYESVLLLDTQGQPLLTLGEQHKLPAVTEALLPVALQTNRIQSSDLFVDESGKARLDILVPLVPETINEQAVAAVILRANLEEFLIPLIEKWPGNSPSAETLLVRRKNNTISSLNKLRRSKAKTFQGTAQTTGENLVAAIATSEEGHGIAQGRDYRDQAVFAAYRPITGSEWRLIAKIDRNEVLAQLWTLVFWVSIVILLAVAAVSMVLVMLWRQQRRAHHLALIVRTAEQDRLLKYFYELPFIGMAIISPDTMRWLRFNDQLCQILGYSREELAEKTWTEMTHPEDIAKDIAEFERARSGESEGYAMDKRFIRKDGSVVIANIDVKCVRRNDGKVDYLIAMIRDVTEQESQKAEILAARRQLEATLDAIPDLLFELDLDGCCHAYHSAHTDLPALPVKDLLGRKITDILPPGAADVIASALQEAQEKGLSTGKQLELELSYGTFWYELSVSRKHVDPGSEPRFIVIARDVTERKAAEQRITNLAHYDALTGLPNRALLADRMKVAIKRAARQSKRLAVLFVDLDRFKPINDSLGHEVGDKLLKVVAARMQDSVRSVDTVSRVGGDEFVVLLSEIESSEDAARVAEKLITELSQPYNIDEHELTLTASVGICIYPDNGTEPSVLLRNADASMYIAKEAGRNRYQFYSDDMTARAIERLSLERDLRGAAERNELFLVYQPQIELTNGYIIGAEVLLRWKHPVRGFISPLRFIPVAEDSGLILGIGERALRESCRQAQVWREQGLLDMRISVNISAVQFRQTDFVEVIERALAEAGLPPDKLELELTESVVMQDVEPALEKLRRLDTLGVKVAIDDFGTGYSRLSSLRQFTVDRLKIDQSFVHDLPGNADAEAIATAIVAMGSSLGLRVIAEGVETEAQEEFLQRISCKEGQGYLYAWPMTTSEFEAWVTAWQLHARASRPGASQTNEK
ncbi:bifunctional diguanylate cyclase/phosphodiesterase [Nitrosovibrio tenuis]|uniref:PAS domain S-box-containing protein/diguanylate cyclase (GGDEF) domain-containing protein n=1 Tax=Nitrosovibrio tenuis TaxID=1233 RepID=A0A1H7MD50_9PROT|nr:EAL domain-containing protein [Nitrosovibrio tenuis]SEL08989.1 PAS domain S-box-containing protein/diguanylate cyclase (GGDEF) domain-containing protein [Nitrosovibrio tenuis]